MAEKQFRMVDGNEAAALVAYRMNEVIAIYPITPSSAMGELSDEWAANGQLNLWGQVPDITEMQSEAGAAGAVHGALQAGGLTTTFTASQGLLLMVPNLFKIAGELNSLCMHVAARTVSTHALSIFGDHSDVMACRQTGMAMLASGSVQEAHDFACIGTASTLRCRVPFIHFFDGFRTSHEVNRIEYLGDDDLAHFVPDELIKAHRDRALNPERPVVRGTAQNPDTFFQAREACNSAYINCVEEVETVMRAFEARTGRAYHLFDYIGHPEAERVMVMMGSGAEAAHETVEHMVEQGEKVGLIKVRLYRPFASEAFVKALPATVKAVAVLDRTKEPGASGEPLYLDVATALREAEDESWYHLSCRPKVVGGRYGLSSKEFNPGNVKSVLDNLAIDRPKNHYTVGIIDDVTYTNLPATTYEIPFKDRVSAVFFGLGSDGTVGSNKNSIKIIGEETEHCAQGYFVYDSKKSGAMTVSHLRFGPGPMRSTYLLNEADFLACHQPVFLERIDMLKYAKPGGVFLLNTAHGPDDAFDSLPLEVQEQIIEKKLRFYVIDAYRVAREAGLGRLISTVMQTCFFALSDVLPREDAIRRIKGAIVKSYQKKGAEVVKRNNAAVDATLSHLHEARVPAAVTTETRMKPLVTIDAPDFIQNVTAIMMANKGDVLPVSVFPVDGTWEPGSSKWEKRNIALDIPIWESKYCIQCNKCAFVCPHAAIRATVFDKKHMDDAPESFKTTPYKGKDFAGNMYTIQIAPEDCTGCGLCVQVCPAKNKENPSRKPINMEPHADHVDAERDNFAFFMKLPLPDRNKVKRDVKGSQLLEPLFEYSGACAGCGETPYIKLLTQLFGDRLLIANATGCSSIFGGNLPTTPYTINRDGRGPAWSNSLFEDNAEFGLGFRLSVDMLEQQSRLLLQKLASHVGDELVTALLEAEQNDEPGIAAQRERVVTLRSKLEAIGSDEAKRLLNIADYLVRKSVWLVGGDGWAYDIGYGGLDHVLASTRNVNVLVLDTEVYSNTGGQSSKATPLGAAAKFAVSGKETGKKDLGLLAMTYGHVYVARVAFGAKDVHTLRAISEAEAHEGPSLVVAYSHCIAHGYDLGNGASQQKMAVESGLWPLYRFDPSRLNRGLPPLQLDSPAPSRDVQEYMANETRFRMVEKRDAARYAMLLDKARKLTNQRLEMYQQLAGIKVSTEGGDSTPNSSV